MYPIDRYHFLKVFVFGLLCKQQYKAMDKRIYFILLVGGLAFIGPKDTTAQFSMSGEIRPRFEYRHGYKTLADSAQDHAAFVDQRTRLNFEYKTEGYDMKIVVQDVRVWGSQPQLASKDGLTAIHEAWATAILGKKLKFKFGRQEIILDDHRIFGSVGWAQQARSHDAGILKYEKEKIKVHFGLAYNQDGAGLVGTSAGNGSYKALQYLWFHDDFTDNLGASILFLNNGKQANLTDTLGNVLSTKDNYSQTYGARISYKKDKLSTNLVYYGQAGVEGDVANTEIQASLVGADLSYKLSDKFTVGAGFEMQSGNSQTDTTASYNEVNHAFNPFYGTNHKFNGLMDYFYVGNHTGSVGLQDIFFKLKYKPEKYFIGLDVHLFSAAADVLDSKKYGEDIAAAITAGSDPSLVKLPAMSRSLGTEIDLVFGFKLSPGVMLKGGYSQMLGTETLAMIKGVTDYRGEGRTDETSNWGWLMIVVKPQFIKQE